MSATIEPPAAPALAMRGVCKRFGPVTALAEVDLELRRGEVHALIGENGAGKSTLVKVLSGAHAPDAGRMEISGSPYRPAGPKDARRRGVAMIYQEQSLAAQLSVEDNVWLGRERVRSWIPRSRLGGIDRRAQRAAVAEAMRALGHPEIAGAGRVSELGPGERQVVEIARALVFDVRVLVLDEPTSTLAADDVERLFALVERLRLRGVAVVYISHFLEEVRRVAQRFTVLRDGRVVARGELSGASERELLAAMAGRAPEGVRSTSERRVGELLLEARALSGAPRPQYASFVLRRGEILGIAGLVGAGRTELLRALFGSGARRAGGVFLHGRELRRLTPRGALERGIGLLSEDRQGEGLAPSMDLADNLTLSRLGPFLRPRRLGRLAAFASIARIDRRAQRAAAAAFVERLRIRCSGVGARMSELSGGNQQKVALARLLHHDVDVLLLDEPTRGIDIASKAEIHRLLRDLAAAGKGLVVVSSYLPELLELCDRIAVMHRGRLGEAREVARWSEESILAEATRGTRDAALTRKEDAT